MTALNHTIVDRLAFKVAVVTVDSVDRQCGDLMPLKHQGKIISI